MAPADVGRRFACTRCRAPRPTVRNRTFGSLAELSGWHRVPCTLTESHKVGGTGMAPADEGGWHRDDAPAWSTNHAAATPIAEGTNRRSGGQTVGIGTDCAVHHTELPGRRLQTDPWNRVNPPEYVATAVPIMPNSVVFPMSDSPVCGFRYACSVLVAAHSRPHCLC